MATEFVHWCDWHIADEQTTRVLATHTHTLTIDGKATEIEVCDECEIKRWEPLTTFVTTFARPVPTEAESRALERKNRKRAADRERDRKVRPGGDSTVCPICQFVAANRTGLGAHVRYNHDTDLTSAFGVSA